MERIAQIENDLRILEAMKVMYEQTSFSDGSALKMGDVIQEHKDIASEELNILLEMLDNEEVV